MKGVKCDSVSVVQRLHQSLTQGIGIAAKQSSAVRFVKHYMAMLLQPMLPLPLAESIARTEAGLRKTLEPLPVLQVAVNTHDLHQQAAR